MNRLDFALRRYEQILPKPVTLWADIPLRDLGIWLAEDVSSVLDEYARRPAFREMASWAIRTLRPGASTEERALIERVDSELTGCAKCLLNLSQQKRIKQLLVQRHQPVKRVVAETVVLNGIRPKVLNRTYGEHSELDELRHQVEAIEKHWGWSDLVNVDDYFEPQQQWVTLDDGKRVQCAEWIVSLNPELLPAGNFIVRCLLQRVSQRADVLEKYQRMCLNCGSEAGAKYEQQCDAVASTWKQLSESLDDLICILRTGSETRLRDACTVATQIYATYHVRPDLTWLGLDTASKENGCRMIKARSTGLQCAHFFERVANALGELKHLYEDETPGRSASEEAVASGGLVILEAKGEVFWDSKRVAITPRGPQWKFLLALARKGLRGSAVVVGDVYDDEVVSDTAMSTTCNRLRNCFPSSFRSLIKPAIERGSYRLELESHLIHVISPANIKPKRD
jgi:hypothetical protein